MKKIKLTALVSLLLITAMLFAACGGEAGLKTISSYDAILNPDYNVNTGVKTSAIALERLDDYILTQSNDNFAVFEKADFDDGKETDLKVVSLRTGAVVVSQTSTEETVYSVTLSDTTPTFTLCKNYGKNLGKFRYTLYDTAGNAVESTSSSQGNPSIFADMILYGASLYKEDKNGNLNWVTVIPENLTLSSAPHAYSEDYFYINTKYGIKIYDRDFNFTAYWDAPQAVSFLRDEDITREVLNNGNVLIQYAVKLDDEATTYDFADAGSNGLIKYDLCTLILNPKNGNTTAVETNYIFSSLVSAFTLSENEDADNRRFSNSFENIAEVYSIVDKRINSSSSGRDFVLVNNNGAVTASLKLAEHQGMDVPSKIANDTYLVSTEYGRAIVDGKGNTIQSINNWSLTIVGEYIVSERAIYDFNMEIVYDLKQNDAKVAGTFDGTIIIVEEVNDTTYEILRLNDGETNTLCTIDFSDEALDGRDNITWDVVAGYYGIYRYATDEYSYYNAKGDLLLKGDYELETVATSDAHGTAILKSDTDEYFLFTK